MIPEAAGLGKRPLGLIGAQDERQLLLLLEVVDLGRQIVPPQRDAKQELHPGHDAVADAEIDQVERATRSFLPGEEPKDVLVPHNGILRGHFSRDVGHAYDVEPSHIL